MKEVVTAQADLVVLLLEDSPEWALLADARLRRALDGRVSIVHHGSLAAAKSTLVEGDFDCVLLDLMLPDSLGLDSVRAVRSRVPRAPIVVLSGESDEALALQAVEEGAQDYLVKGRADGYQLGRAVRYAIKRKAAELALAHSASHDALTGLPNRTLFTERLSLTLARLERRSLGAAVLFVDLNAFKSVNDRFGHQAGDTMLVEAASRLQAAVRPSDTVARFGGDEFLLLCDDVASDEDAIVVAERVADALEEPFDLEGREVRMGASVGIAVAGDRSRSPELLVREADHGMYSAKRRGVRWELTGPSLPTSAA
jgi:diguanylate cyclase (GGDEF)-like protein